MLRKSMDYNIMLKSGNKKMISIEQEDVEDYNGGDNATVSSLNERES